MKGFNNLKFRYNSFKVLLSNTVKKYQTLEKMITPEPSVIKNEIIPFVDKTKLWAHKFFKSDTKITLPVFDFTTGNYTGENAVLDQRIFNSSIRKDIIHRVVLFHQNYKKKTFKWVKSKAEVSGSNKKPFRQKKTGRAPQGDKRAPNLYHGGKAHGARPREFYFPLNKRVVIYAIKSMLTSKLLEGKLVLYNSEKLEKISTNVLSDILKFYNKNKILIITGEGYDINFEKSQTNLKYVKHVTPGQVNTLDLISYKFVLITLNGLEELVNELKNREQKCILRKINKDRYKLDNPAEGITVDFDVTKDLDIKTKSLKNYFEKKDEYLNNYEELRQKELTALDNSIKAKKEKLEKKKKEYEFRRQRKIKRMKERASRGETDNKK